MNRFNSGDSVILHIDKGALKKYNGHSGTIVTEVEDYIYMVLIDMDNRTIKIHGSYLEPIEDENEYESFDLVRITKGNLAGCVGIVLDIDNTGEFAKVVLGYFSEGEYEKIDVDIKVDDIELYVFLETTKIVSYTMDNVNPITANNLQHQNEVESPMDTAVIKKNKTDDEFIEYVKEIRDRLEEAIYEKNWDKCKILNEEYQRLNREK